MFLWKQDELLWGASWLHQASEDSSYMSYIQLNGRTLGAEDDDYSFSWDDKRVGTKILLSKVWFEADFDTIMGNRMIPDISWDQHTKMAGIPAEQDWWAAGL